MLDEPDVLQTVILAADDLDGGNPALGTPLLAQLHALVANGILIPAGPLETILGLYEFGGAADTLTSIQGIGYLLPTNFRVCLELQKQVPDHAEGTHAKITKSPTTISLRWRHRGSCKS